jgi:hypothetical protein
MKSLNTVLALASLYTAPTFTSTAVVVSQNNALIGGQSDILMSQYCIPRDDNPLVPRTYCRDGV